MSIEAIAYVLGARRQARGWIARCPAHKDRSPSLSINVTTDGRPLVKCFAGCTQAQVIDALRSRGLWDDDRILGRRPVAERNAASPTTVDNAKRRLRASVWWRESIPIDGTLAARYLCEARGLSIPVGVSGRVLRFHPRCPFGETKHPCMIALYRDVITDEPRAIHRTALTSAGEKIDRKAWGSTAGAAIKLSANAEVAAGLTVAEGLETAIAGMKFELTPAWALGCADAIRTFPVLGGIETLTILVDNDRSGTGRRAAEECAARWVGAGCEVFQVVPQRTGEDVADILKRST